MARTTPEHTAARSTVQLPLRVPRQLRDRVHRIGATYGLTHAEVLAATVAAWSLLSEVQRREQADVAAANRSPRTPVKGMPAAVGARKT